MTDEEIKLPSASHRTPWLAIGGGLAALALGAFVVLKGPLGGSGPASTAQAQQAGPADVSLEEVTIPVEGMSCGACAARIKKTLKALDGVASIEVSLEHRQVRVGYSETKMTPERLAAEVNSLGYKASLPKASGGAEGAASVAASSSGEKTVIIPVSGMACESCAETVTNLLKGIDGVKEASVKLKAKEARVRYLEGKVKPESLAEEVTAQGFTAGPPRAEAQK